MTARLCPNIACIWIVLLCALVLAGPVQAGERITPSFRVGAEPLPEVLPHVELKAVVAEFLDPLDTGIGKTLAFLLWRETLTAISDQSGAGVILAHTPGDQRLVEMLEQDYHRAAMQIAQEQRGRMVLWGAATEDEGGQVLVNTHLTLLTGSSGSSGLSIRYVPELFDQSRERFEDTIRSPGRDADLRPAIEAIIPRTRFNFGLAALTRQDLFQRPLVTRSRANLRRHPDPGSEKMAQVPPLTVLEAIDMRGGWFKVRLEDHRLAYVSHSVVDLPPRQVEANRTGVNLRSGPGSDHGVLMTADLRGTYAVRNMRYRHGRGLWYQIMVNDRPVWVWAGLVRPRFSTPAVHFLAGLYRFYGQRYSDAVREFEQFVSAPDVDEVNVNLASAYQMLGASQMSIFETAMTREPLEAFTRAIHYTPYDSSAYLLRAVSGLARPETTGQSISDLGQALELDQRSRDARSLLTALGSIARGAARPLVNRRTFLYRYSKELQSLMQEHDVQP